MKRISFIAMSIISALTFACSTENTNSSHVSGGGGVIAPKKDILVGYCTALNVDTGNQLVKEIAIYQHQVRVGTVGEIYKGDGLFAVFTGKVAESDKNRLVYAEVDFVGPSKSGDVFNVNASQSINYRLIFTPGNHLNPNIPGPARQTVRISNLHGFRYGQGGSCWENSARILSLNI